MVLLRRICAVLASVLLIAAIAVGTLADPAMPLQHAIYLAGGATDTTEWLHSHSARGVWEYAVVPVLTRPAWLPLAAMGIVAGGLSMTLPQPGTKKRKVRRS